MTTLVEQNQAQKCIRINPYNFLMKLLQFFLQDETSACS